MPELRHDREELERLEAKLSRMILDERMDEASLAVQIDRVETARANGNKTRSLMLTRMYACSRASSGRASTSCPRNGPRLPGSRSHRLQRFRHRPNRERAPGSRPCRLTTPSRISGRRNERQQEPEEEQ